MQQQLAYINSAGNAVIKVDNTTIGDQSNPEFNRSSVKILSQVTYSSGSLVLMDAVHMPFGVRSHSCSLASALVGSSKLTSIFDAVLGVASILVSRPSLAR
jgi:hypothetical protein